MIRNICNVKVVTPGNLKLTILGRNTSFYWPFRLHFRRLMHGNKNTVSIIARRKLGPGALSLLIIPITSFGLGVWQVERRKYKLEQIHNLQSKKNMDPISLPNNLNDLAELEYCPVHVKGKFHYGNDLIIGPRRLINKPEGSRFQILSNRSNIGYHIVTPFELSDSGKMILVNRGWIPLDKFKDKSYHQNESDKEIEFTGIVRLTDSKPTFGVKQKPDSDIWIYRDVTKMAEIANTEPIFIDADESITVEGGPIGGQTIVSIRNEHLSYIITWFMLSFMSSIMWYFKYIARA